MRRIILQKKDPDAIPFDSVNQDDPIFAKRDGELRGMVVKEDRGWILRTGGSSGASGHYNVLRRCLESDMRFGYEFFI